VGHRTRNCRTVRGTSHKKISNGTLNLTRKQKVQQNPLPQHHRGKATAAVLFHNKADENEIASGTSIPPAAIFALQRSPTFWTLFNKLGLKEESRRSVTKALVSIAASSGAHYLTVEAHASHAFLKTTNVITFTDKDMEVQHPDHSKPLYITAQINDVHIRRALVDIDASLNLIPTSTLKAAGIPFSRIAGAPTEVFGFAGIHECTIGSMQLVLKVGSIVALTRFHVINSPISYHALLGRPWLHKHKLMPFTYRQCVKGRFNGKPILIPTNPTPFDLSKAHYFEATFYDKLTPSGEDSTSRLVGIPLPNWQDIENNPEIDMRSFFDQRKKKRECGETSSSASQPRCVQVQLPDGHLGYHL